MSAINWPTQGENVRLGLSSTIASSTSSQPLPIYDANGQPRTLLPTERLIIDGLQGYVATGVAFVLGAAAGASTVLSSTLIASVSTLAVDLLDTKEGISLPVGVSPSVLSSSQTAVVNLTGFGRIVEGVTQGVRPAYREATTYR